MKTCSTMVSTSLFAALAFVPTASFADDFKRVNLVSDGGAVRTPFHDPNLINPWGLASSPTGPFWVNNAGTGVSTVYDGTGRPYPPANPLIVWVPPKVSAPTGIAYNDTGAFMVGKDGVLAPSVFVFVTEDGVISGWNPSLDPLNGIQAVTSVAVASNYKGVAIADNLLGPMLFAANFLEGRIDVFDQSFEYVRSFTDPSLPTGYRPFNVAEFRGYIYVTFALGDLEGEDDIPGAGHGYIDVFTQNGTLVKRLVSQGALNSPWGMAMAPRGFGQFSGSLLVGNFGDGKINAYNPVTGQYRGQIKAKANRPIVIEGLWALKFGNGRLGGDTRKLYFTAGPGDEQHGLFGYVSKSSN